MYGKDRAGGFRSLMPAGGDSDALDEQIVGAFAEMSSSLAAVPMPLDSAVGDSSARPEVEALLADVRQVRDLRQQPGLGAVGDVVVGSAAILARIGSGALGRREPAVVGRARQSRRNLLQRAGRRRRQQPGHRLRRRRRYPARLRPAGALSRHRNKARRRSVCRGGPASRHLRGRDQPRETRRRTGARVDAGTHLRRPRCLFRRRPPAPADRGRRRARRGLRQRARCRRRLPADAELSHPRDRAARTAVVSRCADDRHCQSRVGRRQRDRDRP